MTKDKYLKCYSSPLSSGVICSMRLFDSSTSFSSQMNVVGGRSSPFPKTNLCISNSNFILLERTHLFSSVHNIESLSATRPMPPLPFGPGWYTRPKSKSHKYLKVFNFSLSTTLIVPVLGTIEISCGWKRAANFSPAWLCKRCQESPGVTKGSFQQNV